MSQTKNHKEFISIDDTDDDKIEEIKLKTEIISVDDEDVKEHRMSQTKNHIEIISIDDTDDDEIEEIKLKTEIISIDDEDVKDHRMSLTKDDKKIISIDDTVDDESDEIKAKTEIISIDEFDDEDIKPLKRHIPRRSRRVRQPPVRLETVPVAGPSRGTPTKSRGKRRINDNRGVHIASGKNVCDCLEEGCAGCFFPCPKCGSQMCGVECRVNRSVPIDSVTIQNTGRILINKYKD